MKKENSFTLEELKEMGLMKSVCNVGILPEQVLEIKKIVMAGEYKSINKFVQEAVREKLSSSTGGQNESKRN